MKARSLVTFTILSQTAAGGFLALILIRSWLLAQIDMQSVNYLTNMVLLGIGLLVVSSLSVSFFHLGSPINAWRAISNLRTSWLSREILFVLLFTTFGALFTGMQWFQISAPLARDLLAWLTTVFGLALVYCMAKVYTLNTVPTWVASRPLASFFLTTLLLGCLFAGAAFALTSIRYLPYDQAALDQLNALAVPIYGLGFITLILISADIIYILKFTACEPVSHGYLHPPDPNPTRLKRLSLALLSLGAAIILLIYFGSFDLWVIGLVFLAAFGLVVIAEILKRTLFYDLRRPEM